MLGLSELRETKVYQEAFQEGEERGVLKGRTEGRAEEAQSLIFRILTRRIGKIKPKLSAQVKALSLTELESLGEALLDFSDAEDLERWLEGN